MVFKIAGVFHMGCDEIHGLPKTMGNKLTMR